jgi:hypothetical protein
MLSIEEEGFWSTRRGLKEGTQFEDRVCHTIFADLFITVSSLTQADYDRVHVEELCLSIEEEGF